LNTISRGFSTADFYLAVPTAIVNFLETDSHTKVIAKPQLRGAEGGKISLKLGQQIPVVSTSYTPIVTGGAGVNPLSSYQYKDVGVNIDMTPRVTLDGDIILDLTLDDSALGADKAVAGVTVPSFVQRTVTTRLRLRDGESNMLAGLLQETSSNNIRGFPGAIHLPFFKQLLSSNNNSSEQTEIVMLLTPHIVRTQELTESDLRPIYIGSQQNLGVGGPPPLIAQQPIEPPPAAAPPAQPGLGQTVPGTTAPATMRGPGGTVVAPPPGSTPVPGTVLVPPAPPTPPAPAPPEPAAAQPAPPPTPPQPTPAAQPTPEPPITSPGIGSAQVVISPSGTAFRVGGGPYVVPLTISDASRISTVTLTLIFDNTNCGPHGAGGQLHAGGRCECCLQSAGER
jgi:general secretion pathway protein D